MSDGLQQTDPSLDGKVAIVTGASRGIGGAIAASSPHVRPGRTSASMLESQLCATR